MSKESRDESRAIRELKKQNARFKQETAQLRKKIKQLEALVEASAYPEDEAVVDIPVKESLRVGSGFLCPKCKSGNTKVFELRQVEYFKCAECGCKGKKN